jgi:hypothetical protein
MKLIIAVVVIAAIAAGLWYTPQGRNLLQKLGVPSADCSSGCEMLTTTAIS